MTACDRHSSNDTPSAPTDSPADSIARYQSPPGVGSPPIRPVGRQAPTAVTAAPKPQGPLPPETSCLSSRCHADLASARHLHGPVSVQGCSTCHQEDQGNHHYPLKRTGNALCTFCHTTGTNRSHVHKAVQDPGCLSCHDPHTSSVKYLLKADSTRQLCLDCHDLPLRRFAHQPFAEGQCTVCHQPHEADNPALLRSGAGRQHCLNCHADTAEQLASAETLHRPLEGGCLTCHDPHTTDQPHVLKAPLDRMCLSCHEDLAKQLDSSAYRHSALNQPQSCSQCHQPHYSNRQHLLADREDQLCLACHAQPITTDTGRNIPSMAIELSGKNLHGPLADGQCAGCHDPHGANRPNLLLAAFPDSFYTPFEIEKYELCFLCHNKALVENERTTRLTDFRDGSLNLHYVHVHRRPKGRTCKACHAVHASDLPKHMATAVPFEGSNWQMPLRFEQTENGGRCSPGCHDPKTYRRDRPSDAPASPAKRGE